jgi:hypothetical protein
MLAVHASIQLSNQLTKFREISYEIYAIWGHLDLIISISNNR